MHKILIMTDFTLLIREWYLRNGRNLPWRQTNDSYKIWISEIILQQTQVKQGIKYYSSFLKAFPDVRTLARASETQVMQQWEGLGYYSRARNLHEAAKTIVNEHNGSLPQTYEKIKTLKGIGQYTASAIASFAFALPHAVVDGNVYRLLSRIFAADFEIDSNEGKKFFEKKAAELLDLNDPATHNHAIMELGALICKPTSPFCTKCPVAKHCKAYAESTQLRYPVKKKKTARKKRYLNFFIVRHQDHIIVQKRIEKDIWQGLYQFPLIETTSSASSKEISRKLRQMTGADAKIICRTEKKHMLTHQVIYASFYNIDWPEDSILPDRFNNIKNKILPFHKALPLPFPRLIRENIENLL